MDRTVDSAITTGMDPSEEARKPAFAGPAGLCACMGLLAGGILGAAATVVVCSDHGVPRASILVPVLAFGGLGAVLGAALGGFLRGFADALWIFPGTLSIVVGALLGAAAGGIAMLVPGVPRFDALLAGIAVGVVLALLFRVFESRLP